MMDVVDVCDVINGDLLHVHDVSLTTIQLSGRC